MKAMRSCQFIANLKALNYEDILDVEQYIVDRGYNLAYPDEVYRYPNGFINWYNEAKLGLVFRYLRNRHGTIVGDDVVGVLGK
jgi:hypothetical protein